MLRLFSLCALMLMMSCQLRALFDVSVVNTRKIINCNSGDNVANITGQNNQVQMIRTGCDATIGSTSSSYVFDAQALPRAYSSVVIGQKSNELMFTIAGQRKMFGYEATKGGKKTTLLLEFADDLDGNAKLFTYTSMPWAGQAANTWTRRIVVPFTVPLKELATTPVQLQFDAQGIVGIAIGYDDADKLQLSINLFNPRAVE